MTQPRLHGKLVTLRPFQADDADAVQALAADRQIADTTLAIPHPYPPGAAAAWIGTHAEAWESGRQAHFAITTETDGVVGAMSLGQIVRDHRWAEVGYWVGVPYWGRGYCTDGCRLLVAFAFDDLGLNRLQATHLVRNPASGRVMQKVGMRLEGIHRDAVEKWDRFEDLASYAILASDPRP